MNTINLTVKQLGLLIGITITVSITLFSGGLFSAVSLRSQFADAAESVTAHQPLEQKHKETAPPREKSQTVSSAESQPASTVLPEPDSKLPYVAQIAVFTTEKRAQAWAGQFEGLDFHPRMFTKAGEKNKTFYAVIAGFYDDRKIAGKESERFFNKFSIKPFVTTSDKLGREIHYKETAEQTLAAVDRNGLL